VSAGPSFQRAISGSRMLSSAAIGVGTPGLGIGTWGCALVRMDARLAGNGKRSRNNVAATTARAPSKPAEPEGLRCPRYEVGELDWDLLVKLLERCGLTVPTMPWSAGEFGPSKISECARRIPYLEAVECVISLREPLFFKGARSWAVGDLVLVRDLRRRDCFRASGNGLAVSCVSSSMLLLVEMCSESAPLTYVLADLAETGGNTRPATKLSGLPSPTAVSEGVDTGGDSTPSRSMCFSSFSRNILASA
jgi:hypothetical protein